MDTKLIYKIITVLLLSLFLTQPIHAAPVTIDYAVFYTPNARIAQGGTEAMIARINTAFSSANELFTLSGLEITHRVVLIQELPINNTSEGVFELSTELAGGFNFFDATAASQADTIVTVVEFQRPGGYAGIPGSRRQALAGGKISLGLPNLSGGVLAHEIGHTLGSGHDYSDASSSFFDDLPTYGTGNHFIGATTGICYRTIMSALINCRVPGHEGRLTVNSNRFSSPDLLFDGTPTGIVNRADNVRSFQYFAPLVASARGENQAPEPTPGATPTAVPDDGDGGMTDNWDRLTLKIAKRNGRAYAQGKCMDVDMEALNGDKIFIFTVNPKTNEKKRIAMATCQSAGTYSTKINVKGTLKARNMRTGRETGRVRYR